MINQSEDSTHVIIWPIIRQYTCLWPIIRQYTCHLTNQKRAHLSFDQSEDSTLVIWPIRRQNSNTGPIPGPESGSSMVGLVCPRCRVVCRGPDNLKSHLVTCAGPDTRAPDQRRDHHRSVPVQSVAPAMRQRGGSTSELEKLENFLFVST